MSEDKNFSWLLSDFQNTENKALGVLLVGKLAAQGKAIDDPRLLALIPEMADAWLKRKGNTNRARLARTERRKHHALFVIAQYVVLLGATVDEAADEISGLVPLSHSTLKDYWGRWEEKEFYKNALESYLQTYQRPKREWRDLPESFKEQWRQELAESLELHFVD